MNSKSINQNTRLQKMMKQRSLWKNFLLQVGVSMVSGFLFILSKKGKKSFLRK